MSPGKSVDQSTPSLLNHPIQLTNKPDQLKPTNQLAVDSIQPAILWTPRGSTRFFLSFFYIHCQLIVTFPGPREICLPVDNRQRKEAISLPHRLV